MEKKYFIAADGSKMEVTVKGSLGLLAYGWQGIKAWREVRIQAHEERLKSEDDGQKSTDK